MYGLKELRLEFLWGKNLDKVIIAPILLCLWFRIRTPNGLITLTSRANVIQYQFFNS